MLAGKFRMSPHGDRDRIARTNSVSSLRGVIERDQCLLANEGPKVL